MERYMLNAQYRGEVKKGFQDIGKGLASFSPQGENRFNVKLDGSVEHPQNHETYEFKVDMDFDLHGTNVRVVRNASRYNDRALEYRERVEKVVPFVHMVKFLAIPGESEEPSRTFRFKGVEFVLRYVPTERHVEASLYEGDTLVGKFFMLKDRAQPPLVFEKFRVPTEGNVVLSFIKL